MGKFEIQNFRRAFYSEALASLAPHRTTTLQLRNAEILAKMRELYRSLCEESEFVEH